MLLPLLTDIKVGKLHHLCEGTRSNKYFPALGKFWADVSFCFMAAVQCGAIYKHLARLGDAGTGARMAGGSTVFSTSMVFMLIVLLLDF